MTYSIAREYFTRLKFEQFAYANLGLGERAFVGTIGFLATWWVGLIIAWLLARRLLPNQPRVRALRQIAAAFAIVFACGVASGVVGFAYGLWRGPNADYSAWNPLLVALGVVDRWAFVRVAYIHNASYVGGVIGFLVALALIRPSAQVK